MRLLIIGAGPGGYETAVEAAARGLDVTIVNEGPLGGTCLNEGCIPTKTFCSMVRGFNPAEGDAAALLRKIQARKAEVVGTLRDGIARLLSNPRISLVEGRAVFTAAHTVRVGETEYAADAVIIASGSEPAYLNVEGAALAEDSSAMLEWEQVPRSLGIIGGGVIGLEAASIFNALGSEVTVIEYCRNILPRFDDDLSKRLRQALSRRGIRFETSACVTRIGPGGSVSFNGKDGERSLSFDKVLMAVGRRPRVDGLGLENAGVEHSCKGIPVDSDMRTNVPGVYAIGDVTGGLMLAHVARYQGLRALNHICGTKDSIDFSVVPAVVFTEPEFAIVGMTADEAKEAGLEYSVHKSMFRANGKAVSEGETDGICKMVTGPQGRIIGCQILGAHASELIHEASALVALGVTASRARDIIHAHPSFSEIISACF